MPPKKYAVITINVSPEERDRVHELAQQRGYKITSDYLRMLIEEDAAAHGVELKFEVDRGGYRGRDEES